MSKPAIQTPADMGRADARSSHPVIRCFITGKGWFRHESVTLWSDAKCAEWASAYDTEVSRRGAL